MKRPYSHGALKADRCQQQSQGHKGGRGVTGGKVGGWCYRPLKARLDEPCDTPSKVGVAWAATRQNGLGSACGEFRPLRWPGRQNL